MPSWWNWTLDNQWVDQLHKEATSRFMCVAEQHLFAKANLISTVKYTVLSQFQQIDTPSFCKSAFYDQGHWICFLNNLGYQWNKLILLFTIRKKVNNPNLSHPGLTRQGCEPITHVNGQLCVVNTSSKFCSPSITVTWPAIFASHSHNFRK